MQTGTFSCIMGFVIGFFLFIMAWNGIKKLKKSTPRVASEEVPQEPKIQESPFCGQCGAAMKKGDAFCGSCGASVK
ncbi:MAG: hypothetical protein RDV48_18975 [Candidatus Eremiobacteraeota bacterium]|nr:hypothetical protein [Candidatus Eremiobacteraeota bacterium]